MKLEHLEYFCKITPGLSLNKLSENMHISVQSLSASIKILENELGCKLLDRTRKGVFFTKEGETFLYYTKAYLDNIRTLQIKATPLKGKLVIPIMQRTVSGFIDKVAEIYLKENPEVDLEFYYSSSTKQNLFYLENDTAEVVFCAMSQFENSENVPEILSYIKDNNYYFTECKNSYTAIEIHKSLLPQLKTFSFKDLSNYDCIVFSYNDAISHDTNDVQTILDSCGCSSKILYEHNYNIYISRLRNGHCFGMTIYQEILPPSDIIQLIPQERFISTIGYVAKVGSTFSPLTKRFLQTIQRI